MKLLKNFILAALLLSVVVLSLPQNGNSQWLQNTSEAHGEDHAAEALKWFYGIRSFGLGHIPQDAWMNALKQKEELRSKFFSKKTGNSIQSASTINWSLIGPVNIQQGLPLPSHAGRVNTIVTDPTNATIAYIGAANGGIWKTTNAGNSWKPLSDNAYSLAMGALAIDPLQPNVLYAGTGEQNGSIDRYFGAGILKTTDAGNSWQLSGLANVGAFSKLIINPHRTSTLYAAGTGSGGGLYISDDAGSTWKKISGSLPPGDVTDISYAQSGNIDNLYVAIPAHGIFLSQDGGNNWNLVNNFSTGIPGQMRRVHVAVDPKNWKDVVGLSINYAGTLEALKRSTDGGNNWDDFTANIGNGHDIFSTPGNPPSLQGWYDAYLERDPSNPDKYIVGGISVWKTEDGGNSWTDVGEAYRSTGIHPDQHAGAFSKSDIFYSGSDGGIAVSTDRGSTYTITQDSLAITQSYGIAIDQTVDDVSYTANQDNGTLTGGRNGEWSEIGTGDGGTVAVDANDHSNVYFIRPGSMIVTPNSNGINSSDSVGWIIPIAQDEKNHIMYTGSRFLYFLKSSSSSWTERPKALSTSGFISAIGPAGDGKTLMIGTSEGRIWSTTDNGITFLDRSAGLPGRHITSIKVSPTDTKTFYITLSGFGASHVIKTSDLGATWMNISSTLPDISCNGIIIDDQHPTNLYAATDIGVFFSPNNGTDWITYGTGLPNVAVTDIAYHKNKRVIRAGTHGRSMWEAPMDATNISGITTPTVSNVWYIGESAQIGWYGIPSPVKIEISTDNAASWKTIADAASGNSFIIGDVRISPAENALIRITNGSQVLQSQSFRIRVRAAGTTLSTFSEQSLYMYDVAYDKDNNTLWVTNFTTATTNPDTKIYKIDPNTGLQTGSINVAGGGYFTGIKYDPATKHLFVHQTRQDNNKTFIFEITTTGSVIHKWGSPCTYGTGVFVSGDSLFLADRNHNVIHVVSKQDPTITYFDIDLTVNGRVAPFGPRCITLDPKSGNLLHTWTDFQGTDANATLYDSYILRLNRDDGTELNSWFVQEGVNSGTNVRGIEYDPRSSGSSVWVTVLNSGNSSKILKITLVDGPKNGVASIMNKSASFGANYPNPFTDYTNILYSTDLDGSVKLIIRDMLGREVYSTTAQFETIGDHRITLPLQSISSGRYFCELYINGIRSDIKALVKE